MRKFFRRYQLMKAYKDVFNTPSGRLVLHDILRATHVFKSSFKPGQPDVSNFQEGERNVALRILAFLGIDDQKIYELAKESENFTVREGDDYGR